MSPETDVSATAPNDSLRADTRGMVMAEYIILIGTVALGSAVAFITLGVAFVRSFDFVRGLLLVPFP